MTEVEELRAQVVKLTQRVTALEVALLPFARYARFMAERWDKLQKVDDGSIYGGFKQVGAAIASHLTYGAFRRASTTLFCGSFVEQVERARRHTESRYRHKKRGSVVTVLGVHSLQSENPIAEGEKLVVYIHDADKTLWARPVPEFYDGRFEAVIDPVIWPIGREANHGDAKV